MRIPHALLPVIRTVIVVVFAALCAGIFGYLWLNSGGKLPLLSRPGYQVTVLLSDVDNLVYQSDVRTAGVDVGKVEDVEIVGGAVAVTMQLDEDAAPLHEGVTITVRNKTMIEETYLDVVDGAGEPIADGTTLPEDAGRPSVQLDDVLTSLDADTRESLGAMLRSSGQASEDSAEDISRILAGLGDIGRTGGDALTALAAQSDELSTLAANTTTLLRALDTRHGRIKQLVTDSASLTETVAANREDVEALMRTLPTVLRTTSDVSADLERLGSSLAPVAAHLREAAPELTEAMRELPATSGDLRALLPDLDQVLDRAPQTLHRVPAFSRVVRPMASTMHVSLGDVNPMLHYLQPYGSDLAAFFTNFSQFLSGSDRNGPIARVLPLFNEKSLNSPGNSHVGPLNKHNPYPEPGAGDDPRPFSGEYPRVEQEDGQR